MDMDYLRKFTVVLISFYLIINYSATAQNDTETIGSYNFEIIKKIPQTSVKDQAKSGTCWSFSTLSFIESELLRMGKPEYDLSEMFVVRNIYSDKAVNYVRFHGKVNFGSGGAFHDIMNCIKKYGMVPEEVYDGIKIGEKKHIHGEMDVVLKAIVDGVITNKSKKLTPVWLDAFNAVLDVYLGKIPETFTYNKKTYTSKSFAEELGINPEDYVELTSYTHHPFYEGFIIEIPDNWSMDETYNLPIDEFIEVIDNAINNGYSVAWGSDVSEKGFAWKKGIAIVPEKELKDLTETELAKWSKLSTDEKDSKVFHLNNPVPEKKITQEMRQEAFDNYKTTDDHGMHIIGIAKDQNGTKYYIVKNSWGSNNNPCNGYLYASESWVRYKTMDIMLHKDAIPKYILKKLKLK